MELATKKETASICVRIYATNDWKWFELEADIEDMRKKISDFVGVHEEWEICDMEGFYGIDLDGSSDLEKLYEFYDVLYNSAWDKELIAEIWNMNIVSDISEVNEWIQDHYIGEYEDVGDYAYQFYQDCCEKIDSFYENYIDFDRAGKDMEYGGDIFCITLGYKSCHVFHNH